MDEVGPIRVEPHLLPEDLRDFLRALAAKLAKEPDLLAHDADCAYADRIDDSSFDITYITADDWKWTFHVEVGALPALVEEDSSVPLWVCADENCGYRFGDDAGRCPNCATNLGGPDDDLDEKAAKGLGRLFADLLADLPKVRSEPSPPPAAAAPPKLLPLLVERGDVELEDGADLETLSEGAERIASHAGHPDGKAAQLIDWLLDQDGVAEVYISDDDLSKLLEAW